MATQLMQGHAGLVKLRIEDLERQLAEEKANLARIQQPEEPQGDFAVIRFAKYGNTYAFAAIRVQDAFGGYRWYVTQDGSRSSRQGHAPRTWDELLAWIGERNWDRIEVLS